MTATILEGDVRDRLGDIADGTVQTCITSPPYFGLRDYGTGQWTGGDPACAHRVGGQVPDSNAPGAITAGVRPGVDASRCCDCGAQRADRQIGLEPTPEAFVAELVAVFAEVRRVLRDDGTLWLNMGDSYCAALTGSRDSERERIGWDGPFKVPSTRRRTVSHRGSDRRVLPDAKPKDLLMMPARVALALQADGWYLRSHIIGAKVAPMPESVTDRPTSAHESIFLLTKRPRYFYDSDAIRESAVSDHASGNGYDRGERATYRNLDGSARGQKQGWADIGGSRNKRNVWEWRPEPFPDAHFAVMPTSIVEPCVLAGSSPKACGVCGAPFERVVEGTESTWAARKAAGATWGNVENAASNGGTQRVVHGEGVSRDLTPTLGRTVGWAPLCDHDDDTGRSVVLDPFAGSGTVGVVCRWYGRDFVGIELSESYAELARRRIETDGALGRPAKRPRQDPGGQLDLLGMAGA